MVTATQSKTEASAPAFEVPSIDEATQKVRDLNERILESSKTVSLTTLDAYEKAVHGLVDVEQKLASSSKLDWVSALAGTHTKFVSDVTDSYTKVARDLLK